MNAANHRPIEKNVVLLGAGNAHLVFVKRFGMKPIPGVAVTLVSEASEIPYSAMVTGHIGGDYSREQITIDLVRLCAIVGVRFIAARVEGIDPARQKVALAGRVPVSYNVLSLGLGSLPVLPASSTAGLMSLVMRPMGPFLDQLAELEAGLKQNPRPFHFVIVGGGASGCELALAIRKRLGGTAGFRITLLQANERLVPNLPAKTEQSFRQAFDERGIAVRVKTRVTGSDGGNLLLENGERLACDAVLWATDASPPALLRETGLALAEGGFLKVRDTLQSVSDPAVFGTGDCVSFVSYPELPRNGVLAVRQGATLFDNVTAFVYEQPLQPFRPQKLCLSLLNTADGDAILSYGPLSLKNRWGRKLKDRIDRTWIEKYQKLQAMAEPADENGEPLMRCGGCGSKISGDVLSAALKRIELTDDPRILMGCRAGEDAAVHRFRPELFGTDTSQMVEVQTVDFFKSFVDDPFLFGRLAALHAVSDLYAMNARPFSALAIATLPYARGPIQEAQLFELLSGAVRTFKELGVSLTGGHTTEGNELALGFSVTGYGEEGRLFQKGKLTPGDRLVLTKPLGSGALLAAWMRGGCRASWFDKLMASMLLANRKAAEVFAQAGVTACTDITGFGLAGHLLEMLDPSRCSARLHAAQVPIHDGFQEVVAGGTVSTLHRDNAKISSRIQGPADLPAWLFDPQTSGGLLAGVKPDKLESVLEQLRAAGYPASAVIGEVEALANGAAPVIQVKS